MTVVTRIATLSSILLVSMGLMPQVSLAAGPAADKDTLAMAQWVEVGKEPCQDGKVVNISPRGNQTGHFNLEVDHKTYDMHPVHSTTGAIRLEDNKHELVWLQLSNKSMLMNEKMGKRVADGCMSDKQHAVAQQMKDSGQPGLLDDTSKKSK